MEKYTMNEAAKDEVDYLGNLKYLMSQLSFKEIVDLTKSEQAFLSNKIKGLQKIFDAMKIEFQKFVSEKFQKFPIEVNIVQEGTISYGDSKLVLYVYPFYGEGKAFLKIEGKWQWYKTDGYVIDVYSHKIISDSKLDPPFDVEELESLCAQTVSKYGVEVNIMEYKIKEVTRPRDSDDLLSLYPNSEVVAEGKIWYIGWDIPDYWVILRVKNDGYHVFYSENSHGFGFDCHIKPDEDYSPFLEKMNQEGFDGNKELVESYLNEQ
jgi:hypothetical protein